mgnify:CR=1 FL=1|jgi:outer membrane protein assembly factor BamE (lipoprotein component of BamABCDE complex)|tara:strand:- start:175 stop:639 length:465 start_codon:yes stop_codon:yes gene_type:complete
MKNFIYIITVFILFSNCTFNKVAKYHGVRFLENKQKNLIINVSNKNDIISLLGPPSTKSSFDNALWIYIERLVTKKPLIKLGSDKLLKNNVLVLEINDKGLLHKKIFYKIDKMNDIDFSKMKTNDNLSKKSFVYSFLSSMRQKINDPLGKRKKR